MLGDRPATSPSHGPIAGVNRRPRFDASLRCGKFASPIEACFRWGGSYTADLGMAGITAPQHPEFALRIDACYPGMPMIRLLPIVAVCTLLAASAALAAASTNDPLRGLPEPIPTAWLNASRHPRWVCTPTELTATRRELAASEPVQTFLKDQVELTARFAKMPVEKLIALVPRGKSQFVYGLGMNLDPVYKMRMRWAGWNRPFAVRDIKGNEYPNAAWPDRGDGVADPKTGERYYFIAQANAKIMQLLEQRILPALADVYA